ncbi:MAG: hypothetical protein AAGJ40_15345 [Planctomycetota bacterium]
MSDHSGRYRISQRQWQGNRLVKGEHQMTAVVTPSNGIVYRTDTPVRFIRIVKSRFELGLG